MRRLMPVVLATLLATLLGGPATVALAAPVGEPATAVVVLAAEGGGEPAGVEPRGPEDPENSFAPADYEAPFLINAAVGLAALMLLLVVGVGGLYWLLVQRPRKAGASAH